MNNQKCYLMHGHVNFSLEGGGELYRYLSYQYDYFEDLENAEPCEDSFTLKIKDNIEAHEEVQFNNGHEYYSKELDMHWFIWAVGKHRMALDGRRSLFKQDVLTFESGFNRMKANLICDLMLRLRFIKHGIVLTHAASVSKSGFTFLLPAWKGMRKTATCLKLVEAGYDFLADDRVWVSETGNVLAYPRYVVIKNSNADFFPQFDHLASGSKRRLYRFLETLEGIKGQRVINRFKQSLAPPQYFYINELYPDAKIRESANLTHVIHITQNKDCRKISVESVKVDHLVASTCLVNNFEWNHALLDLAAAHDVMFGNSPSWTSELMHLMQREQNAIVKAYADTSCGVLTLPENTKLINWKDLPEQLVSI